MIVMKFGGTSVESAAAMERVAGIVKARLDRQPVVVVSAMGKTTNRLLAIAEKAWKGDRLGNLVYRRTARNFNPVMATAGRVTIAEVEELVEPGVLDPDAIVTPGVYV